MTNWVMDYETIINCFVAIFEDYQSNEQRIFVIHELRDDRQALIDFLESNVQNKEWHISFNGLAFDSQITQYILNDKAGIMFVPAEEAAHKIYLKAQAIIDRQNGNQFQEFSERQLSIKQVDVFKLNHWDNPAKRSSLKWIQYSMDWYNIQDMPIHHSHLIRTQGQIKEIITYCSNDVKSTKRIMQLSKDQINLRATLTKEYNISLYSASEPRISKELFMHFLSKETGIKKWDLRHMRTKRSQIRMSDIILPYIQFQRPEFKNLLDKFNSLVINPLDTKGGFKHSINYRGVKTDFGLGGVHGAKQSGVYEPEEGWTIMTSDVTSFYPNLAIRNKWAPAHLPQAEFCELYEWFFDERKKISKKDIKNYVYKIILNSTFGLSIDQNSFLYDPQFGMQITINGQLTLMMLYEMLCEAIPEAIPLMQNTDGLEMMIPNSAKQKYMEICAQWEKVTMLQLEHDEYQKIVLADVNNYIAVNNYKSISDEGYEKMKQENPHYLFRQVSGSWEYASVKCKGRFEFKDLALHKNKSFLVIPKALFYYFVHDLPPETYLIENRNIFDYCAGVKIKGSWKFYQTCMIDGKVQYDDLQNTLRYFITDTGGCKIIKRNNGDGREIQLESGRWMQSLFTVYEKLEWEDYHINEAFYIDKIYREIRNVAPNAMSNQLTMF